MKTLDIILAVGTGGSVLLALAVIALVASACREHLADKRGGRS